MNTKELSIYCQVIPYTTYPKNELFIQCINYIEFKSHAKGTLCGVLIQKDPEIGIILCMDDTSTSFVFVTNLKCVFEKTSGGMNFLTM